MNRTDTIRSAYDRFNAKDFEGVLKYFHADIEHDDAPQEGVIVKGTEAILRPDRLTTLSEIAPSRRYQDGRGYQPPVWRLGRPATTRQTRGWRAAPELCLTLRP